LTVDSTKALEDWLSRQPPEVAMALMFRAVARIAVIWWDWAAYSSLKDTGQGQIAVLRALLTIRAAINNKSQAMSEAVQRAQLQLLSAQDAAHQLMDATKQWSQNAELPIAALVPIIDALQITEDYCIGVGCWLEGTSPTSVAIIVRNATELPESNPGRRMVQIERDCATVDQGLDLLLVPLWGEIDPPWHQHWNAVQNRQREELEPDFWIGWYRSVWGGGPQIGDVLRRLATIPDSDWVMGYPHIAEVFGSVLGEPFAGADEDFGRADRHSDTGFTPKSAKTEIIRVAIARNRLDLPPTFDAIEGLLLFEIEREQRSLPNGKSELEDAKRRIRFLFDLHTAVARLRDATPLVEVPTLEQAAVVGKLFHLYSQKVISLPRVKADEVVEGIWSTGKAIVQIGLILGTTKLAMQLGLNQQGAMAAATFVFARKSADDIIKAAGQLLSPTPK
jgi:hypothetical protein